MTIQGFNQKVLISGHTVEEYKYKTKTQIRGYKRGTRTEKIKSKKEGKKKGNSEKTKFAINRAKTQIRRLISANEDLTKFLTLTSKITDIAQSNRFFNLFTQKMRGRFPEFKYLAILEFQKDTDFYGVIKPDGGAVHYHIVCNLRYVKATEIAKIWSHGSIQIEMKKNDNLWQYLCKYLQKDMSDSRMTGKKKYFGSRGLNRPLEIIGDQAEAFMTSNTTLELIAEKTFLNEYAGEVDYKMYKIHDSPA